MKCYIYSKLQLPTINCSLWEHLQNTPERNLKYVGCHDDEPFAKTARPNSRNSRLSPSAMDPHYLIGLLHPEKTNEERAKLINDFTWDTRLRNNSKFEELIRCATKAQIFFADFLGLRGTYNRSGTSHPDNCKLRLSKDYQAKFYKNLERKEWQGIALNMPGLFKYIS